MARIDLEKIRSFGDITQSFRWIFVVLKAPTAAGLVFPSSDDIDLRVETAELPKKSGSSVEITLKGHTVKYPGIYKPGGTLTFGFVETVDNKIASWLRSWQVACWGDNTGTRATKKELQADIQLQLLRNDDAPRWQYTMKGCYLEDSTPGQLDGSSPDPLKPQLVMSYDDFTQGPL